jgi:two-component system OmpR family sensor kinase
MMFAAGLAVLLIGVGLFVYARAGSDILDSVDAGLRSRAEILAADVRANGPQLANVGAQLIENDEAFAQLIGQSGTILQSSAIVGAAPMLDAATLSRVTKPTLFNGHVAKIDNITRILALPVQAPTGRLILLVGASLQDRRDQLLSLAGTLTVGGLLALVLISFAGWLLAGAALRPVERMRADAAGISAADLERRLSIPRADDEMSRLGRTLNDMLDRLGSSFVRERRLLDNASHEMRTPLAILKAELDLAASRERTPDELLSTLQRAREETDHLVRLAEDLMVLSRTIDGQLPVHRRPERLDEVLGTAVDRSRPASERAGVELDVFAPPADVSIDRVRVRQMVDDLLDNALRHTPAGGRIEVRGDMNDGTVQVVVRDTGPGFPPAFLAHAFDPFSRGSANDDGDHTGLGLAIVRAIAQAHGGGAEAANLEPHGAEISVTLSSGE